MTQPLDFRSPSYASKQLPCDVDAEAGARGQSVVLSLWRGPIVVKAKTAREIITEIAESYGLTFADMKGPVKTNETAHVRQEAMWACRQVKGKDGKPRYSRYFIGQLLGGRDDTTVLWGERQHAKRLAAEKVAA